MLSENSVAVRQLYLILDWVGHIHVKEHRGTQGDTDCLRTKVSLKYGEAPPHKPQPPTAIM